MQGDKTLDTLQINESAVVREVRGKTEIKRRFLDLGLINGTRVKALFKSPYGDPTAFLIRGTVIALRAEDSGKILIY